MPANIKKADYEIMTRLISPEDLVDKSPLIPSTPEKKTETLPKIFPSPYKGDERKVLSKKDIPFSEGIVDKEQNSKDFVEKRFFQDTDKGNFPLKPEIPPSKHLPSLREKLFDESIIGSLAKKDMKKEEREEKVFTFDAKEYKFLLYNKRLKERIESIWIYPPDAAAKGIFGDLVIRFSIKKNGRLGEIELIRTSGHKSLDDAAIKALRDGEPYWPLPEEWGMDIYTIVGHFIYTIHGYYIR